jgi:hypothetical protein
LAKFVFGRDVQEIESGCASDHKDGSESDGEAEAIPSLRPRMTRISANGGGGKILPGQLVGCDELRRQIVEEAFFFAASAPNFVRAPVLRKLLPLSLCGQVIIMRFPHRKAFDCIFDEMPFCWRTF